MINVHSFYRKRPHILPPLLNSYSSSFRTVDPVQPPDSLLTKHRFGSPIPRPSDPKESDYAHNETDDIPKIKINESCQNDGEKYDLMKFNLLSDPILGKTNNLMQQIQKDPLPWREIEREHSLYRSLSKKQFKKSADEVMFQATSSEKHKNANVSEPKFLQIPNRYTLLKPIGEKT